jgi:hypothetical protein
MAKVSEESLASNLKALSIGQSFSRTVRLPVAKGVGEKVPPAMARLRNQLNQAAGRLRGNGSNFRVESGIAMTDDKTAILATVAVTRMEGQSSEEDEEEVEI